MLKQLQRFLFKRKYIKVLWQQIWENEIEIAHQAKGIADVEAEKIRHQKRADVMQQDFDELNASHKREDREQAKVLAKDLTDQKQLVGKHEMSAATLRKNIESKKTSNEYLLGKIKFVKANF